MKKILLIGVLLLISVSALSAQVPDMRELSTFKVPAAVLQVAVAADGQRFYLLLDNGTIQLHQQDGRLLTTIEGAEDVSAMETLGENRLLLYKGRSREVLIAGVFPRVEITENDAPAMGPSTAPVTIVVYDDFECPYCARTVKPLKELLARYPEQVRLVFKNFPLRMHKNARFAALAGLAAQRQGQFWPLHDLLFANYDRLSPDKIRVLARSLPLDMKRFERDLQDSDLDQQLSATIRQGQSIGVRGTPTLFINGRRVQQRSIEAMKQMIDEELKRLEKSDS